MERRNTGNQISDKNHQQNFLLYLMNNYLVYIIMAVAIIVFIFISDDSGKILDKFLKLLENPTKRMPILAIALAILAILIIFISLAVIGSRKFKVTEDKKLKSLEGKSKKTFVKQLTKEEYEIVKQETTKKELEKLYENPQFQTLLNERGTDSKKWAWQSREKEKRVVYRDNEDSEEIDHLSQITLSDD